MSGFSVGGEFNKKLLQGGIYLDNVALECRLYSEVSTPLSKLSVIDDFLETEFSGYLRVAIGDPESTFVDPYGNAISLFGEVVFTPSAMGDSGDVLGLFVVDLTDFIFAWAMQLFASPKLISPGDTALSYCPIFYQQSQQFPT